MEIKRGALKLSLGFLLLSALFAIFVVLVGRFGEFETKVLLTTLSISVASMCAMACGAHIERTRVAAIGSIGIISAVLSLTFVMISVWAEVDSKEFLKLSLSCVVVSFALAHALLLNLPDLANNHLWLRYFADFTIGLLAVLVIYLVWKEGPWAAPYFKLLIVVGIGIALVSLLIPIFSKLGNDSPKSEEEVLLKRHEGDVYVDKNGEYYQLHKMSAVRNDRK